MKTNKFKNHINWSSLGFSLGFVSGFIGNESSFSINNRLSSSSSISKFNILNDWIFVGENAITISPDLVIKDFNQSKNLVCELELIYKELSVLSDKGFINDPYLNLPIALNIFNHLNKSKEGLVFDGSIGLNVLCYNLVLLIILRIIIMVEQWHGTNCSKDQKQDNSVIDLKNLRKNVLLMLHPFIKNRVRSKGLFVYLNTISGYDAEYELVSSLEKLNKLISIQLACNSYISVKVPNVKMEPLSINDLVIKGRKLDGSSDLIDYFCFSIDNIISEIRNASYLANDLLLVKLTEMFDKLVEEGKIRDKTRLFDTENNFTIYTFPKTNVKTLIKYLDSYSSIDLIRDLENLGDDDHKTALTNLINILNKVSNSKEITERMQTSINNSVCKPTSRISYKYNDSKNMLSISVNRVLYLCMHESSADLSMLSDFDAFKENLNIVAKSFVTVGKPLVVDFADGTFSKSRVHIRDTILIAPQGAKSLAAVGKIYGPDYHKIDIGEYRNGKMAALLIDDPDKFERYAIRDAVITLKHATMMEEFYFSLGKIGVPLTITGISKAYVLKEWFLQSYEGYQLDSDIMIGNLLSRLTPKDARGIGLSKYIVQYVSSYRGGRNESMMYGVDKILENRSDKILENGRSYIDYDMTSAYTTVMSILGHPEYKYAVRLSDKEVKEMFDKDPRQFLFNYIVLDVKFKFDHKTKYPSIPARVDEHVDIYPLEGKSVITGPEYLVARSIGCDITVKEGVLIPFKGFKSKVEISKNRKEISKVEDKDEITSYEAPFRQIIMDLQRKRREHPKKTFYNYMFKEIGNSIYGLIAMGLAGKTSFDIKTKSYLRVDGGILSNPVLASYITGFCRAFIGECVNNVQLLEGFVVSITTDGFISDLEDLENKILGLKDSNIHCFKVYKELRKLLTTTEEGAFDDSALEIKNIESRGLLTWKTRGQFGLTDKGLSAFTGFQKYHYGRDFLEDKMGEIINSNTTKNIEYVQSGLRGGSDIYKYGGHVINKHADRNYSLEYDNKRCVMEDRTVYNLYDSKPWFNIQEYSKIRVLKELINTPIYQGYSVQPSKSYKSYLETGVRGFIKVYLKEPERYGIPNNMFPTYKALIKFIHEFEPALEVKLSLTGISNLKSRNTLSRSVPRNDENEAFVNYIKHHINTFNDDLFFRELSPEARDARFVKKDRNIKSKGEQPIS